MLSLQLLLGSLWAFGNNTNFNLGTQDDQVVSTFQRIGELSPTLVSANELGTIILDSNNVVSSGRNTYKQLGNAGAEITSFQQSVYSGEKIVEFQLGNKHSIFRDLEGNVFGSGSNTAGQLQPNEGTYADSYDKVKIRTISLLESDETVQRVLAWKDLSLIMGTKNIYVLGSCAACSHSVRGVQVLNLPVPVSEIRNLTAFPSAVILVTQSQQIFYLGETHCGPASNAAFRRLPFSHVTQLSVGSELSLFVQDERLIMCRDGAHRFLGPRLPSVVGITAYGSGFVAVTSVSTVYYCARWEQFEEDLMGCAVEGEFDGSNALTSSEYGGVFLYSQTPTRSYYTKQGVTEMNAQNIVSGWFFDVLGEVQVDQYAFRDYSYMPKLVQYAETAKGFLGLSSAGKLYAGGQNVQGELGMESQGSLGLKPVLVPYFQDLKVLSIASSGTLSVAVDSDKKVFVFGAIQSLLDAVSDEYLGDFGSPRLLDLSFLTDDEELRQAWPLEGFIYCLTNKRLLRISDGVKSIEGNARYIERVEAFQTGVLLAYKDGTGRFLGRNGAGELCQPRGKEFLGEPTPKIALESLQRAAVGDKMTLLATKKGVFFCGQNYFDSVGKSARVFSQTVEIKNYERPVLLRKIDAVDVGVAGQFLLIQTEDEGLLGMGDRRITSPPGPYLQGWKNLGTFNLPKIQASVLLQMNSKPIDNEDSQIIYRHPRRHFSLTEELLIVLVTFVTVIMLAVAILVVLSIAKNKLGPAVGFATRSAKMRRVADQGKHKMI